MFGGSGQDQMLGGGGDDVIHGNADTDLLEGQDGADWISGGAWIDIIVADVRPEYFADGSNDLDDIDGHRDAGPDNQLGTSDDPADDNATDILLINGSQFNDTILLGQVPAGELLAGQLRIDYTSVDDADVVRFERDIDMIWRDSDGHPLIEQFRVAGLGGDDHLEFIEGENALDLTDLMNRGRDFVGVLDGGPGDDLLYGSPARDRLERQ
jgi:Ca2+-binding RTX toxin-like protein